MQALDPSALMNNRVRLALAIVGTLVMMFELVCFFVEGNSDFGTDTKSSTTDIVVSVDPTDKSGLKTGDIIDKPSMDLRSRLIYGCASRHVGEYVDLSVIRGARHLSIREFFNDRESSHSLAALLPDDIPAIIWKVGFLLVGVLVLLRGRGDAAMYLAVMSIAFAISGNVSWDNLLPPVARSLYENVFQLLAFNAALLTFYLFIEAMCSKLSPIWLTMTARGLVAAPLVLHLVTIPFDTIAQFTGVTLVNFYGPIFYNPNPIFVTGFLYFLPAYVRSSGLERRRLGWIFWTTLLGLSGPVIENASAYFPVIPVGLPILNTTPIIMAVGYPYVILRHRVFDVNLIVSRTLVFTVLTAFVVGIFALTESVVERAAFGIWETRAVSLFVPLLVGMTIHPLRKRIEGLIERLFFRRKHEIEEALQRLVPMASSAQRPLQLIEKFSGKLRQVTGSVQVALYENENGRFSRVYAAGAGCLPAKVGDFDPVVKRANGELKPIDLHEVDSEVARLGCVFPMGLRGRVVGLVICEQKENDVPFEPLEKHLILEMAREMAMELHTMRTIGK